MEAEAQLGTWLVRDVNGVYLMDMSGPEPVLGPFVNGLGTNGLEDVNLMTDGNNDLLFCLAVNSQHEIRVYGADLQPMLNGTGLLGHTSTSHSVISPVPCHAHQYFVVHLVTANSGGPGTLYYSKVDMSLNGGLGAVLDKNTLVSMNVNEGLAVSQVLPNGCRWLFGSRRVGSTYEVVRWLISQTGIGPPTVIASVSIGQAVHYNDLELDPANGRLAMSMYNWFSAADVALWQLDLASGTLSDQQTLSVSQDPIIGLQFSPSGEYLYCLGNSESASMDLSRVHVPTGVVQLIEPDMGSHLVHLELAANGKIYAGRNMGAQHMAVVANPDAPSVAEIGFQLDGVFISSAGVRPGLPSAIEGEPPGTHVTPAYIDFSAYLVDGCATYQFVDSTCLATWWEWDFGDGVISHEQAPAHTFAIGAYDVTLRVVACGDTLSLTKPGYIESDEVIPVASFIGPDTLCPGEVAAFFDQSEMAVSIEWDMGDGTTSQASAPIHIFTEPGSYTVQLVAFGPCSTDTATALVTVLPGPVASFSGPDTLCLGEAAAFFDQSELATGIEWDMGDGTTLQSSSPVHMFTEPGPYTVQLVASGPCFNDTATMVVTVLPLTVASFTGPDSLCIGEVANFFDQSEMAGMIEWDMGDGTTSQASAPTHLFSEPGSYTVSLVATGYCLTDTATALVTVLSQAVASFSVSSDTCDLRIVLAATGSDDAELIWDLGDGTTSQSSLLAHSYAASGTYQVTLVAFGSGMCADTATVFVEVGMAVEARPEITVGCDGMVVMQDMIGTAATWAWSLGDGGTAASDSLEHAYAAPGTYEVTLVVGNGDACSSTYVLP
jgi:PKD repeat protein